MRIQAPPSQLQLETDSRFPSGPWTGFYLQCGSRERMQISLQFAGGVIRGDGTDPVGEFTIRGRYNLKDGQVTLFKGYIGAHDVYYNGVGEGADLWLWGLWHLPEERGGFHMWPTGEPDPTKRRTAASRPVPCQVEAIVRLEPQEVDQKTCLAGAVFPGSVPIKKEDPCTT